MLKRWQFSVSVLAAALLLLPACSLPSTAADQKGKQDQGDWAQLFNGKDLSGWDTWLGAPEGEKSIVGLNKNERNVYSVVQIDGKPAIRISGEIWGALISQKEYENFHVRLEFKWGEQKWKPREKKEDRRDSGLLYYSYGENGAHRTFWMKSVECQIMENDCGDFYSVGKGPIVNVEGEVGGPKKLITYKKGGTKHAGINQRIIRDVNHEKPLGEWNTIEVFAVGSTAVHVVNGKANLVLTNIRRKVDDKEEPLTKGKIQIQSEGAEVFYRNIAIRPIKEIPAAYLK